MGYITDTFDVIVVGAGHAGVEAALAAARLGGKTLLATLSLDNVALMPCNPSIGGPAKGHLVRELDALGGQMGISADLACIQMRLLNTGKGYAVHALRGQEDKPYYHTLMKHIIEQQDNLELKQLMIDRVLVENGQVVGVEAETGEVFEAKCVILATGTYLRGRIVYGQVNYECGPNGLRSAQKLSASLLENGVELMRFKTGTPARLDARSLDYSKMEPQYGDEEVRNFSFISDIKTREQVPCYLTYTNEATHKIIRDNLHLSGMYNGMIEGVGPRYCPSIESKLVRFANKERHQLFIEPEGRSTTEMYVQGMSSSLPAHIQLQFMQTIPGLEHCKMMRAGYAIDYDCLNPLQLTASLEHKAISGLFSAGQSNGTSGYEEAAAQGLMAGINAMRKINGCDPFILRRDEAYIGVLIDDLVTKGVDEPYRMFTSRAEYRILLRQDDADMRLTERAYQLGLVKQDRYDWLCRKREEINRIVEFAKTYSIKADKINDALESLGTARLTHGCKLIELISRPQITIENIAPHVPAFQHLLEQIEVRKDEIIEAAEVLIKYKGYIDRERMIADKIHRLESIRIKGKFDYMSLQSLSTEARQKLIKIDPETLAQASRIPGISPSDINVLLVLLGR